MSLLIDKDLKDLVFAEAVRSQDGKSPLVSATAKDWTARDSAIQPCSVDLTIGFIQVPSVQEDGDIKTVFRRGDEVVLETGETAVVTTAEILNVPSDIAGIGFPPSHVSIKGLLMTNPGHVDPGYAGPMHFTVINMGRQPYTLGIGDPICTLLFCRLKEAVAANWGKRNGKEAEYKGTDKSTGLEESDVNRLSRDFINLERRSKKIANKAVRNAALYSGIIALLITVVSQVLPYWLGGLQQLKQSNAVMTEQIDELKRRISTLESQNVKPPVNKFRAPTPANTRR